MAGQGVRAAEPANGGRRIPASSDGNCATVRKSITLFPTDFVLFVAVYASCCYTSSSIAVVDPHGWKGYVLRSVHKIFESGPRYEVLECLSMTIGPFNLRWLDRVESYPAPVLSTHAYKKTGTCTATHDGNIEPCYTDHSAVGMYASAGIVRAPPTNLQEEAMRTRQRPWQ